MNGAEVIDAESREVAVVPAAPAALFGTTDPVEIVAKARDVANALKDVLRQQGLITNIQGKEYVQVGGWTLLGTMLGVFPVLDWCRKLDNGWEARVTAQTMSGIVVGAAEAECTREEKMWAGRDDYALRSMAQTRATSKALRMPLGFVVTLAGFAATPAEEMIGVNDTPARAQPQQARTPAAKPGVRAPLCPRHDQECNFVPAGTSAKTGKKYGAFYSCPDRSCTAGNNGKNWTIFTSDWSDQLSRDANEDTPRAEADPDELPYE